MDIAANAHSCYLFECGNNRTKTPICLTAFFDDETFYRRAFFHNTAKKMSRWAKFFPTSPPIDRTSCFRRDTIAFSRPTAFIYKLFHSSFKTGYHRPFRVTFAYVLAGRTISQSLQVVSCRLRSWRTFFSSSTVESRRGGPTFLSLCLRLRKCDLICLLNGGLDDHLLFGRKSGGELSVKLRLGL